MRKKGAKEQQEEQGKEKRKLRLHWLVKIIQIFHT